MSNDGRKVASSGLSRIALLVSLSVTLSTGCILGEYDFGPEPEQPRSDQPIDAPTADAGQPDDADEIPPGMEGLEWAYWDEFDTPELAEYELPYKTNGDYLAVYQPESGTYRDLFMMGANLGIGLPGMSAGELGATREQYARWLDLMRRAGFNTVRTYTLHYPRFYEVFMAYNQAHPEHPLYLLQGIWMHEELETGDLIADQTHHFDHDIEEVIDAMHGNRSIDLRYGRAFGEYDVNVSPWVLGWIIGREITHEEADFVNKKYTGMNSYQGDALSISFSPEMIPEGQAKALDVWAVQRLDKVIVYERETYGVQRPVSFSSWPTLDPIVHPTENPEFTDEDLVQFDLAPTDLSNAPGGMFMTFHAYPYYPDFINEDPGYRSYEDEFGPNSYLGYITDLRRHYGPEIPVYIGEFGVPSSWGSAHAAHSGMEHGGNDEHEQGAMDARQLINMLQAGCAGGGVFAWIDEWWKRTWVTDEIDFPRERRMFWWNVTAAEQNFGLIAFDLGEPQWDDWPPTESEGRVQKVRADYDAAFFHVELTLSEPLTQEDTLVIGFDTYRDDLGELVLPDGTRTERRNEMALTYTPGDPFAQLWVMESYDLRGIWHNTSPPEQIFQSTASESGRWNPVQWQNNQEHVTNLGQYFPPAYTNVGELRIRSLGDMETSHDAVIDEGRIIRLRMPWVLIQFTDPSLLQVMHDDRSTRGRETRTSSGVAMSVVVNGELQMETSRHLWQAWNEAPEYTERVKPSMWILAQAIEDLPNWID